MRPSLVQHGCFAVLAAAALLAAAGCTAPVDVGEPGAASHIPAPTILERDDRVLIVNTDTSAGMEAQLVGLLDSDDAGCVGVTDRDSGEFTLVAFPPNTQWDDDAAVLVPDAHGATSQFSFGTSVGLGGGHVQMDHFEATDELVESCATAKQGMFVASSLGLMGSLSDTM